ncbi:hypothetical protein [uncultured Gimesia sp.]|uniref:hypothetical protein n=1 Tax=uncultured Gimesia sp. TaxID=1678688 RepID=UPI0026123085|nr:hypothetical protein [uncultured Gimesia sp.]
MKNKSLKQPIIGTSAWSTKEPNILSEESLLIIKTTLEKEGSLIIEHWHYHGSRAPDLLIFDDYEDFLEYIYDNAIAGDIIDTWAMHKLCKNDNKLVSGKCPNEDDLTPESGSY